MAIRIAVIGLGSRGRDWVRHVRLAPAFELAAAVDSDAQVLERAARSHGLPPHLCFTDLRDGLDRSRSGAVIVATPPDQHHAACALALSLRLPVLVEKPFAMTLADAAGLVSAADAAAVPLLVGQNYRYMRAFRAARRVVASGELGRLQLLTCHYYRAHHELAASLARLPHAVLWGVGVHHLDMLRHVLGQPIVEVSAESFSAGSSKGDAGADAPAGASFRAMLTTSDGIFAIYTATYESSGHQFFERGQEFYCRIVGDRGTLHIVHRWLVLCTNGRLPRLVRRGARMEEEQVLLRQFERAINHGEEAEVSGRENLQTMAVLEACLRSSSERRWVNPQDLM